MLLARVLPIISSAIEIYSVLQGLLSSSLLQDSVTWPGRTDYPLTVVCHVQR